jgi:rubrerythrin
MTTNLGVKKKLEDRAINEMQHLGWLSEKMVDIGG